MAKKRMFSRDVLNTDSFKNLPLTAQALYFHLNLEADDDGFVGSLYSTARGIGATEKDVQMLLDKRFLLKFDDGVAVIKHWRMHNIIKKDRYTPTRFTEHMSKLIVKKNGAYTEKDGSGMEPKRNAGGARLEPKRSATGAQTETKQTDCAPQVRLGKDRLDNNIYIVEQVIDFLNEKCGTHYQSKTANTKKHINARVADGFSLDDFKKVITKKAKEWMGTDMEQFLRPETLFGTKFESYLNAPDPRPRGNSFQRMSERDYDFKKIEEGILNQ